MNRRRLLEAKGKALRKEGTPEYKVFFEGDPDANLAWGKGIWTPGIIRCKVNYITVTGQNCSDYLLAETTGERLHVYPVRGKLDRHKIVRTLKPEAKNKDHNLQYYDYFDEDVLIASLHDIILPPDIVSIMLHQTLVREGNVVTPTPEYMDGLFWDVLPENIKSSLDAEANSVAHESDQVTEPTIEEKYAGHWEMSGFRGRDK